MEREKGKEKTDGLEQEEGLGKGEGEKEKGKDKWSWVGRRIRDGQKEIKVKGGDYRDKRKGQEDLGWRKEAGKKGTERENEK